MPRREKFSEKSLRALSSWNRMCDGAGLVGGEEENASERRGFRDRVDFRLGAIKQLTRERERNMQKSTNKININIKINEGTYA